MGGGILMMTRKDYVAVSELLSRYALSIDENTFDILIHDFAGLMAQDNERFIADRFISACWNGNESDWHFNCCHAGRTNPPAGVAQWLGIENLRPLSLL